ncbi:MAG: endonuclease III [Hydrotalea sp.]|nr:endonuclease III [Hydrotalea sp.]
MTRPKSPSSSEARPQVASAVGQNFGQTNLPSSSGAVGQTKLVKKIFAAFRQHNPEPKGELYHTNNFTLLLAVILSAQATDAGVNKATRPLFDKIATPQDVIDMGLEKFTDAVRSIGLYKTKASNIMKTCHILVEKHNGVVPQTMDELRQLPGVGRKTANVVLNIAFGQPTIAVDTHVFRVSNRLGLCRTTNPEKTEEALLKIIPTEFLSHAHHWLILHGRYICKSQNPQCTNCFLTNWCEFYRTNK